MIQGEIGDTVATLQGVPRAQAIEVLKDAAAALKKIKLDSDASTTVRRHAKPSTTVSVRPHSPVQSGTASGYQEEVSTGSQARPDSSEQSMNPAASSSQDESVTDQGDPPNAGPSPGNVAPERPMQIVSMDFVLPLPESRQGNTALLLSQDMFTGYITSKAMRDTSAQVEYR
jgi:hypothetical protein